MKFIRLANLLIISIFAAGLAAAISFCEVTAYSFGGGPVGVIVPLLIGVPYFGPGALLGVTIATLLGWRFGFRSFGLLLIFLIAWASAFLAAYLFYMNGNPKIEPDFVFRILAGHVILCFILTFMMRLGYVGAYSGETE